MVSIETPRREEGRRLGKRQELLDSMRSQLGHAQEQVHGLYGRQVPAQSIIPPSGLGTCHIGLGLRVFARWQNRLNVLNVFAVYSVWHFKSAS